MQWEKNIQEKFDHLIGKVPVFMRDFARDKVLKKIESIVAHNGRAHATEKDVVDAFFAATPFGFHGPMKNDMAELGIDYAQYGHPK